MRYRIIIILTSFLLSFSLVNPAFSQVRSKTFQQIQLLLREKNSRSSAQRKIDSRLLQASREHQGRQMVTGVDLRPIKINADTKGNLKVDIKAAVNDALITKIEALGGKIIYSSNRYNTIKAEVNLSSVETIAGYPEVKFVQPAARAITIDAPDSIHHHLASLPIILKPARSSFAERSAKVRTQLLNYLESQESSRPYTGSVTSQGDRAHRADDVRSTYGYSGQGIRIGVLSDSYDALNGASIDVMNGDLPGFGNPLGNTTPVTVLADVADGEDEGRAMLQIVHDLAPKAQLFFATADVSDANFATNIEALRNAPNNCDIIIDDVFYEDEPVFQDGIIAQAINTVTANGALYFSSAGNEGSVEKNTAGYYEGDFNDSGSAVFASPDISKTGTIHNFGTIAAPMNGDIIISSGFTYTLNWADPIGASDNDYDLFLVGADSSIKASSTNIQNGTQDPFEEIDPLDLEVGDRLVVFKSASAQARAFAINTLRGTLTVVTTGQTHGHSSAVNAFSVAATPAATPFSSSTISGPYPLAFSSNNQVESFSSDGPRHMFFNADSTAITPGNFLFKTNGGNVRNKPDITAADGVVTTLRAGSGLNPFYGTSAAAPHAAAIAALLKSANPTLTAAQIRTIITSTALDIESPGYDNVSGFGIVQAFQAMQLLNPAPSANISLGVTTPAEGTFSNGNGRLDPGELGKLTVQLINATSLSATNVTAVLTTNTPGVIITQDSANYGTIPDSSNVINTATPFQFGINSSVPCGTIITFTLTVTFGNGSPQVFLINVTIGVQPWTAISNKLGSVPATDSGFIFSNGTQTGRITRNAPVSVCGTQKITPPIFAISGARAVDAYIFTNNNTTSQCVTTTMTANDGINMYAIAYDSSGFVPLSPTTDYLADQGSSGPTQTFGFTAPAGKPFTIVVLELNPATAVDSAYKLNISLTNCASGPACSPVNITSTSIAAANTNSVYTQSFTASGGSGSYIYSLSGILPGGLSFSGNTLAGTPQQAGIFPVTVTATDVTGCPLGIQADTIVVEQEEPVTYVFNGDGNWTDTANWIDNNVPPATLIPGSQIIIDPLPGGQCVLNIPYTLTPGCIITVNATKNFVVQGNLTQQN